MNHIRCYVEPFEMALKEYDWNWQINEIDDLEKMGIWTSKTKYKIDE